MSAMQDIIVWSGWSGFAHGFLCGLCFAGFVGSMVFLFHLRSIGK